MTACGPPTPASVRWPERADAEVAVRPKRPLSAVRPTSSGRPPRPCRGLPGHDGPIRDEPLDDDAWRSLTGQIHAQGLQGFLLAAIDGGALQATQEQYEHACQLHLDGCSSVLLPEQRLLDVADILDSHDLATLPATAAIESLAPP
jgi:hypothetical protein